MNLSLSFSLDLSRSCSSSLAILVPHLSIYLDRTPSRSYIIVVCVAALSYSRRRERLRCIRFMQINVYSLQLNRGRSHREERIASRATRFLDAHDRPTTIDIFFVFPSISVRGSREARDREEAAMRLSRVYRTSPSEVSEVNEER